MLESAKLQRGNKSRKAFIFTTDAFLVLPLVILVISAFVSFSVTIKETIVMQEYAYLIGRDTIQYLSDITATEAGIGASNRSVLEYIVVQIATSNPNLQSIVSSAIDRTVPATAGYSFEYRDASGTWVQVRQGGNINKISNPKFQTSAVKVVTALTDPQAPAFQNCAASIECLPSPATRYVAGQVSGPMLVRIRIFI